jgi:hypothetical protein
MAVIVSKPKASNKGMKNKVKKREPRQPELSFETPALNLLTGKFLYKYNSCKLRKLEGYVSRYAVRLRLIDDDSPIKRVEIFLENSGRKQSPTMRFALPVVIWEMLQDRLGEYIAEVKSELDARGDVSPAAYRLKRRRRE